MPSRTISGNPTLARRLREARERAGLPQDRLGVLAGLEESSSSARMSRYENGVHAPPIQFVEAIAKVLGIPAPFFYCKDDRLADLIRIYGELPEAKREALYAAGVNLAG